MKKEKGKKTHLKAQLNPQTLSHACSASLASLRLALSRTRPPPPAPAPAAAARTSLCERSPPFAAPPPPPATSAGRSSTPIGAAELPTPMGPPTPIGEALTLRLAIRHA